MSSNRKTLTKVDFSHCKLCGKYELENRFLVTKFDYSSLIRYVKRLCKMHVKRYVPSFASAFYACFVGLQRTAAWLSTSFVNGS